ncbi:MAG: N-acetylmuramoyl-L-alanine amidase family protein, partial [Chloroflexota bacterium]
MDPGHGGSEIGAVYVGASGRVELLEKDVNLAIGRRLAALLRAAGYRVLLTRDGDVGANTPPVDRTGDGKIDVQDDLQARLDLANAAGASLLLSLHNNGHPDASLSGSEVYYCQHRPYAERNATLANLLQGAFVRRLGEVGYSTVDRGAKGDADFRVIDGVSYHASLLGPAQPPRIVRPSQMPAVIGESLFLTNPEGALLGRADVQDAIAHAYLDAVEGY